jgi:hypothetical protein
VPKEAVLPDCCVKCGNPAAQPWLTKAFYWHNPWLKLLILSPIIWAIVVTIVRKNRRLSVPLCEFHKSLRAKRLWIGGILLGASIPLPVCVAVYAENETVGWIAFWAGVAMLLTGTIFVTVAAPLKAIHISADSAKFSGACPAFLAAVDSRATPRAHAASG